MKKKQARITKHVIEKRKGKTQRLSVVDIRKLKHNAEAIRGRKGLFLPKDRISRGRRSDGKTGQRKSQASSSGQVVRSQPSTFSRSFLPQQTNNDGTRRNGYAIYPTKHLPQQQQQQQRKTITSPQKSVLDPLNPYLTNEQRKQLQQEQRKNFGGGGYYQPPPPHTMIAQPTPPPQFQYNHVPLMVGGGGGGGLFGHHHHHQTTTCHPNYYYPQQHQALFLPQQQQQQREPKTKLYDRIKKAYEQGYIFYTSVAPFDAKKTKPDGDLIGLQGSQDRTSIWILSWRWKELRNEERMSREGQKMRKKKCRFLQVVRPIL